MFRKALNALLCSLGSLWIAFPLCAQSKQPGSKKVLDTTVCEIVRDALRFDDKRVRFAARFESDGIERSALVDSGCSRGIIPFVPNQFEDDPGIEAFDRALEKGRRGTIDKNVIATFTGRFTIKPNRNSHPSFILEIESIENLVVTMIDLKPHLPHPVNPAEQEPNFSDAPSTPIETTVCKIMENPSAFNNKLVKVRGYVSVSFEYSMLRAEGCSDALWFAIADGSGPPELVATVNGSGRPGGINTKGTPLKPIPVKLVRDANLEKFEHYMTVKAEDKPCWDLLADPTPPDCDVDRVMATFIGRIDSVSKEIHGAHLKRSSFDHPDFKGFGQMGMFDAQLVLQSVQDVLVVDSLGNAKP